MKRLVNKKGFTLIEVAIVAVTIGIISAIAIPRFGNVMTKLKIIMMGASVGSPKKKNGNTKTPPLPELETSNAPIPSITKPTTRRRSSRIFTAVRLRFFSILNNIWQMA